MSDEAELAEIEAITPVTHLVAAVVARHLVHFADVLGLALVHIREVIENAALDYFFVEN